MLEVKGLNVAYGRAQIIFDLDLEVGRGEVVALLGRNGAGKSTTLKAIMGLVPARSGRIEFAGRSIAGLPPHAIARAGLGYVPEDRRIFAGLTVAQNLEVGRQPARPGLPLWGLDRIFGLFPTLAALLDRPGGRLSGGEQQMLAVARTLMGNPSALLLDEPSEGLAPLVVEQMAETIRRLKQEGLAVLLCEQSLRFARAVADRACLLERGHIRQCGSFSEIAAASA